MVLAHKFIDNTSERRRRWRYWKGLIKFSKINTRRISSQMALHRPWVTDGENVVERINVGYNHIKHLWGRQHMYIQLKRQIFHIGRGDPETHGNLCGAPTILQAI